MFHKRSSVINLIYSGQLQFSYKDKKDHSLKQKISQEGHSEEGISLKY